MLRRVIAFVVAAAVMVLLGSAAHSYFVQEAWSMAAGQAGGTASVAIPFGERVSWAGHDLVGMVVPYSFVTSIALCIAFLAAGALARFTGRRVIVYGLALASAIFATFTALKLGLGSVGIFGARGAFGLAAQMAVGLVAGLVLAQLTAPRESLAGGYMKKLKHEAELYKAALLAGVQYAEGRKAVEFESTDSASDKALYIYRLLVHDKVISPMPENQVGEKTIRHRLAAWYAHQLPDGHPLLD